MVKPQFKGPKKSPYKTGQRENQ